MAEWVIVWGNATSLAETRPKAEQFKDGIKYFIPIAKKHRLKVFPGTLLPVYGRRTYAPFREEMKNKFNDRVRGFDGADGYIDFDKILRSDNNAAAFAEGYDSGDHLHPGESAYKVMADAAFGGLKK